MYYLYGAKIGGEKKLVATFDSEQQLLAYVRWATLSESDGKSKFEQGSSLVGCQTWSFAAASETADNPESVDHNPSPSML